MKRTDAVTVEWLPRFLDGSAVPEVISMTIGERRFAAIDPADRAAANRIAQKAASAAGVDPGVDISAVIAAVQAALRSIANPPEVYEHFSYAHAVGEKNGSTHAVCGKVWKPSADVTVVGKCPECVARVESGWTR